MNGKTGKKQKLLTVFEADLITIAAKKVATSRATHTAI